MFYLLVKLFYLPVATLKDALSNIFKLLAGPTQGSDETCKIPYFINSVEYNFCSQTSILVPWICETESGVQRNCTRGNISIKSYYQTQI